MERCESVPSQETVAVSIVITGLKNANHFISHNERGDILARHKVASLDKRLHDTPQKYRQAWLGSIHSAMGDFEGALA